VKFDSTWRSGLLLLLVCFAAFWWRLGAIGLIDPDEPFYAQSAREMVQTHDWLTPRIYGAPQFEKPIFYYWLVAASFKALGETEFSGRLPTALSATILVLLTWLWGRRTFNPQAGFLAAVILATGLEFSVMSRLMLTDVPLAVFLAASLFSYWQAATGPARRQSWLFAHFVFTALAVLTKGPIGSLIPLLAILTFSAITRTPLLLRGKGFLAGLAAYVLLVVPWYALMFARFGWQFWEEFFIRDNWLRLIRAEHPANNHFYYYAGLLILGSIPWLPAVVLTLRRLWGDARQDRRLMFLCSWLLSSLVFLTIAQSKLPSYCFFLFVPLALLVGVTLESICRVGFRTRGECRLVVGAAVFQCVAALAAPLVKVAQPFEVSALLTAACLAAAALFLWRRKWQSWVLASALSSLVLICSALTFSREHVEADSSARPVAARLLQLRQNGEPLLSGKFLVRGLIYYTRLPVTILASKAQPFWAAHPLPVVVWKGEGLEQFLAAHPTALCAIRVPEWQTLSKNPAFADQDALEDSGPNVLVRAHAPASTAEHPGAALPAQ
jgi:4-amino-4-deoxy-L-arabinose transferase-like glycosyltransferase